MEITSRCQIVSNINIFTIISVIMLFKINGERNSGTNFLKKLLKRNFENINLYDSKEDSKFMYNWKHAIPNDNIKKLDKRVIDIFIFRNLDDWLVSMYKNPYHLKRFNNFESFLKEKQKTLEIKKQLLDKITNKLFCIDDDGKTIFEIRYYKFKGIMNYVMKNKDIILVNLSFLQNKNKCLKFLRSLKKKFQLKKNGNFAVNIPHTKNRKNDKNRNYNININLYKNIINKNKNNIVENYIDNLTLMIK